MDRTIGVTERQTFRRCRLAWKWQFKDRLELADQGGLATSLGTFVHTVLATFYRERTVTVQAALALAREAGELPQLNSEREEEALQLLDQYDAHRMDRQWEPLSVELPLEAPIPKTKVSLRGAIDLLVKYQGRKWIVDHKTVKSYATPAKLETDDQITAYIWLAQQLGLNPAGVIYNQIGKRKSPPFVQTVEATRSPAQLETFENNLILEARDMTSKSTRIYPSFGEHCAWCQMRSLCITTLDKGNVEMVKQYFYALKPPRKQAVEQPDF